MGDNTEPVTHVVTQTDTAAQHVIDPVIHHTEKITRLEEQLGHQGEKLTNDMFQMESRLNEAISRGAGQEQIDALRSRLESIENSLSDLAAKVTAPPVQAAAQEERTLVNVPGELVGDVEGGGGQNVERKKESERPRGIRRRRKARKGGR